MKDLPGIDTSAILRFLTARPTDKPQKRVHLGEKGAYKKRRKNRTKYRRSKKKRKR